MKTITHIKLQEILRLHYLYLNNDPNGVKADLSYTDISYTNLLFANLSNANLTNANLTNANLMFANLNNADLSNVDLSNANLRYANLSYANLNNANLNNADLSNVDLSNANLRYANLSYANLNNANLNNANLSNVDLSNANLDNANLTNANLIGSNLDNAILGSNEDLVIKKTSILENGIDKHMVKLCDGKLCKFFSKKGSGCYMMPYLYTTIPGESTCVLHFPELLYSFPDLQHSCKVCGFYVDNGCINEQLTGFTLGKRNKKLVKKRIKFAKKHGEYPLCIGFVSRDTISKLLTFVLPNNVTGDSVTDIISLKIKREFVAGLERMSDEFKEKEKILKQKHNREIKELNKTIRSLAPKHISRTSYDGGELLSTDGNLGLALLDMFDEY